MFFWGLHHVLLLCDAEPDTLCISKSEGLLLPLSVKLYNESYPLQESLDRDIQNYFIDEFEHDCHTEESGRHGENSGRVCSHGSDLSSSYQSIEEDSAYLIENMDVESRMDFLNIEYLDFINTF